MKMAREKVLPAVRMGMKTDGMMEMMAHTVRQRLEGGYGVERAEIPEADVVVECADGEEGQHPSDRDYRNQGFLNSVSHVNFSLFVVLSLPRP